MSAYFLAINLDQSPFSETHAGRMMAQLDCFGIDHAKLHVQGCFAIGYQGFWTTAEDEGQVQPIKEADSYFVFCGRIDNRETLFGLLGLPPQTNISDPALMLRFLNHFDGQQLTQVIGSFSFVLFNSSTGEVTAARDPMGGRNLVWYQNQQHLFIATYEMALAAHPHIGYQINQPKAARFLLNIMEAITSSSIRKIKVLEPGSVLEFRSGNLRHYRFYESDAACRIRYDDNQHYAKEFKRLLQQAVVRRMRCRGNIGSLCSGGLDSLPITIVAQHAAEKQGQTLIAFQWVFEHYPDADERQFSLPSLQQHGVQLQQLLCDDVWPGFAQGYHLDPVFPFTNPYIGYQEAALKAAQQAQVRVMLTGIHGDLLYEDVQGCVYELIANKEWRQAWKVFCYYWKTETSKWRVIRNLLIHPSRFYAIYSAFRSRWFKNEFKPLQDHLARQLQAEQYENEPHPLADESKRALRPHQWRTLFGGFAGEDIALGRTLEANYAVERRYPMRDRDLVEFMAAIPSSQLYNFGLARPIVLNAFADDLPAIVRERNAKTNFSSVINAKINADQAAAARFAESKPVWAEYVNDCYFDLNAPKNQAFTVVQWRCAHYDYWKSVCYNRTQYDLGLENHESNTE